MGTTYFCKLLGIYTNRFERFVISITNKMKRAPLKQKYYQNFTLGIGRSPLDLAAMATTYFCKLLGMYTNRFDRFVISITNKNQTCFSDAEILLKLYC
jgi:hypothetical protein